MPSLDEVLNNASSDEFEVDFSAAVDFEPIAAGDYPAVIEEVKPDVTGENSKSPGSPKFVFRFKVIEGEHEGRVFFRHSPASGKGAGLTKDVLRAVGVDVSGDSVKFKGSQVTGQKVILEISFKPDAEYPNEVRKVKAYKAASPLV